MGNRNTDHLSLFIWPDVVFYLENANLRYTRTLVAQAFTEIKLQAASPQKAKIYRSESLLLLNPRLGHLLRQYTILYMM